MKNLETTQAGIGSRAVYTVFVADAHYDIHTHMDFGGKVVEIVDIWRGSFSGLPAMLTECALDPVCRTFSGVARILAAEGTPVGPSSIVVGLVLREVGSSIQIVQSVPK